MTEKALVYSYTSLKQFENCPKAFYHKYVAKDVTEPTFTERSFGIDAHKNLESHIRAPEAAPRETIADTPFCADVLSRLPPEAPPSAEVKLGMTKALAGTPFFSRDVWLRGVVDCLSVGKRAALVFDWKFGKRRPDTFQLDVFALLVFHNYPAVERVMAGLVWEKVRAVDRKEYGREDAPALAAAVITKTNQIEEATAAHNWPCIPSGLCRYCLVDQSRCVYAHARGESEAGDQA